MYGSVNQSVPWREGKRGGKAQMGALKLGAGGSRLISFVYQPTRYSTSSYLQTFACCNTGVAQP